MTAIAGYAPDLRAPWALAGAEDRAVPLSGSLTFWMPARATWPDGARVTVGRRDGPSAELLSVAILEFFERDESPQSVDLVDLVIAAKAWDAEILGRGWFPTSVYFASDAAVASLIHTAREGVEGTAHPANAASISDVLSRLFQLELVYRFPVALKFRGSFGMDRQTRLNCWGRRLAARLECSPAYRERARCLGESVRAHLTYYEQLYREHIDLLTTLTDHAPGAAWQSAQRLPVGILF